ncbi:MAG: four helix bundle protein [Acidobacteria bacterium]|nr:four helix bundle protein [Acidobacteriota bacterium]
MNNETKPRSYKDLKVWQKGIEISRLIYEITSKFPTEEKYGLVSQMRRAAVSIVSNIAEGQARHTTGELLQFLSNAYGSSAELETQLILSRDFRFCSEGDFGRAANMIDEEQKMLSGMRRGLEAGGRQGDSRHSLLATRH